MPRKRNPRPVRPAESRLPRGVDPRMLSPDRCSRCGKVAESPYICNACKSALTVAGRQIWEAKDAQALADRRKRNAEWMRAYRARRALARLPAARA